MKTSPLKICKIASFFHEFYIMNSKEILFPIKNIYFIKKDLMLFSKQIEKNVANHFEEYPIAISGKPEIEEVACNLLSDFLLTKQNKKKLNTKFITYEIKYGKIFKSVFYYEVLKILKIDIVDVSKFEKQIKYGNIAKKLPKNINNAFLYGVFQKNCNSTKLILQSSCNIKKVIPSFLKELKETDKHINLLLSLCDISNEYINIGIFKQLYQI